MTHAVNAIAIDDLGFEVLPGGASEAVIHLPAVRVVIAVVVLLYSTPLN